MDRLTGRHHRWIFSPAAVDPPIAPRTRAAEQCIEAPMPYLLNFGPDYEHDIFVSYAHGPLITDWSREFADDLVQHVNFSLRERALPAVGLWMDEEIEGNLPLTRQRLHKASTSALLIVIMSDFYLDSDWCKDEAAWFEEADGGWANTDGRIFVVKTSRTDPNRWPKLLRGLKGYDFYKEDRPGGSVRPLSKTDTAYSLSMATLADAIARQLKLIELQLQCRPALPSVPRSDVEPERPGAPLPKQSSDMGPDIFISYAREDQARGAPLVGALERHGWSVFWDHDIPPGETWRSHIGKALKGTRCVIVAWSEHSIEAEWVIEEAEVGKQRGILVPVRLESVDPPMGFGSITAADLSMWTSDSPLSDRFLDAVRKRLER